jgi:hypothetical protein
MPNRRCHEAVIAELAQRLKARSTTSGAHSAKTGDARRANAER